MPEVIQNIDFVWPWVFVFLPLPLLLSIWNSLTKTKSTQSIAGHIKKSETLENTTKKIKSKNQIAANVVRVSPLLESALSEVTTSKRRGINLRSLLLWICWLLLLVSLARPLMLTEKSLQPASGRALSLVVDLSGSMERDDFVIDGLKTDRLSAVKVIAADFLQKRQGDRVSLILYGDTAFTAAPLSFDLNAISNLLASSGIGMAGRATAIGDALGLAILSLREDDSPEKAIVLLSDGTNNAGTAEPESAATLAESLGIRIHTIGLGSEDTGNQSSGSFSTAPSADLDEEALRAIAELANGQFFRATTTAELTSVYQNIHDLEGGTSTIPPLLLKSDVRNLPILGLLFTSLLLATLELLRGKRYGRRYAGRQTTGTTTTREAVTMSKVP